MDAITSNLTKALNRIAEKLKKAGASVPAPEIQGTIESSIITGLSIALLLVQQELEIELTRWSPCHLSKTCACFDKEGNQISICFNRAATEGK